MDSAPIPSKEALELSHLLISKIDQLIGQEGPISFSHFMQMALYEPGLGYYSAGSLKLGSEGDFVTAPEVSSFFGQCLARQVQQVLELTGGDTILEPGAGTGHLACDILEHLETLGALPGNYQILEVSADLRERQERLIRTRIPHLMDRISWLDRLPEQPFKGVILANEVLDALPVDRFQIIKSELKELRVTMENDQFTFDTAMPAAELQSGFDDLGVANLPDQYISEINQRLPLWFAGLADSLDKGVIFCVDYGYSRRDYYHPQRNNGTLLCHYRHRAHGDPFIHIGLQDITASVDFTAVAEAAFASGLTVHGYTTQAYFLMNCGLLELLAETEGSGEYNSGSYLKRSQQVKTLILPGEMGERFKVIALSKNIDDPLIGFSSSDQRGYL